MTITIPNKIRLPMPHKGMTHVMRERKRFTQVIAGRRWRKTTLDVLVGADELIAGKTLIWGAPTYNQVRIGFNEMIKAFGGLADVNYSRLELRFQKGLIYFRSLDNPDNARGLTADGAIIDEWPYINARAWHEIVRPMLIDTNGWALLNGTPKGHNFAFQEYQAGLDREDTICFQIPTVGCEIVNNQLIRQAHRLENPSIPFGEIENLFATMPELVFRQEILAEFLEGQGAVFRRIRECATALVCEPYEGQFVGGLDLAQQNDFSVITILDKDTRQMVDIDRFNQTSWAIQRHRIQAMCEKWQIQSLICELNSIGSPNFEALQQQGLPVIGFTTTAQSKPPLIESLVLAFERGEIGIFDYPLLIGELEAYERQVNRITGRSQYSAPEGLHDDMVMSLALAWHGVQTPDWIFYDGEFH